MNPTPAQGLVKASPHFTQLQQQVPFQGAEAGHTRVSSAYHSALDRINSDRLERLFHCCHVEGIFSAWQSRRNTRSLHSRRSAMSLAALSKAPHQRFLTAHPACAEVRLTTSYVFLKETWLEIYNIPPSTLHNGDFTLKDAVSFVADIPVCLCAGAALWRPAAPGSRSTCCTLKTLRWTSIHFHSLCPDKTPFPQRHEPLRAGGRASRRGVLPRAPGLPQPRPAWHLPPPPPWAPHLSRSGPYCQRHLSWTCAFNFSNLVFLPLMETRDDI